MKHDTKDFTRWLSFQNLPNHWDTWERATVKRLLRKAWKAGRQWEQQAKADMKPRAPVEFENMEMGDEA